MLFHTNREVVNSDLWAGYCVCQVKDKPRLYVGVRSLSAAGLCRVYSAIPIPVLIIIIIIIIQGLYSANSLPVPVLQIFVAWAFVFSMTPLFLPLIRGTIPSTDTKDEAPFSPLTPTVGHYSSHWHHQWGTTLPSNPNNGAIFLCLLTTGAM